MFQFQLLQKNNPKNINFIQDLQNKEISMVLGNEATAVGKIANKIIKDYDLNNINIIAKQTTAAPIYTALEKGECDAIINWKDNTGSNCQIIDQISMNKYTKVINAALLEFVENKEAQKAFTNFLETNKDKKYLDKIWL